MLGKNNKRHDYEKVKIEFEEKNYTLISTGYKNNSEKLDYICNKHQELGIQNVSYVSFSKNKCNCSRCKYENIKKKKGTKRILPQKIDSHYDKYFSKYQQKLKEQADGDEYILNKLYSDNGKTMLDLIHLKCNEHYHVEQNKFFVSRNRCQNKKCKSERKSKQKIKTLEQVKREIMDLVGDEYKIVSEYNGTNENVVFYHKSCDDTFKMTPHNFFAGQRCTHCSIVPSVGEQAIIDILKNKNIKYTFQKSFDDLHGFCGYPLSYDFYLKDYNLLIEYQGEYHDGSVRFIPKSKLIKGQKYDQLKREYAESHGIQLLEIWYWDFNNIEKILENALDKLRLVS